MVISDDFLYAKNHDSHIINKLTSCAEHGLLTKNKRLQRVAWLSMCYYQLLLNFVLVQFLYHILGLHGRVGQSAYTDCHYAGFNGWAIPRFNGICMASRLHSISETKRWNTGVEILIQVYGQKLQNWNHFQVEIYSI